MELHLLSNKTINRNPVKKWLFTFPKSGDITRKEFAESLAVNPIEYWQVCQEHHEDGTLHLHALIIYEKKQKKTDIKKHITRVYPDDWKRIHFSHVRSLPHIFDYLKKEDTKPLENIPYNEYNPSYKLLTRARKIKWFNSSYKEFNQIVGTRFTNGTQLYDYLIHLKSLVDSKTSHYQEVQQEPIKKIIGN